MGIILKRRFMCLVENRIRRTIVAKPVDLKFEKPDKVYRLLTLTVSHLTLVNLGRYLPTNPKITLPQNAPISIKST